MGKVVDLEVGDARCAAARVEMAHDVERSYELAVAAGALEVTNLRAGSDRGDWLDERLSRLDGGRTLVAGMVGDVRALIVSKAAVELHDLREMMNAVLGVLDQMLA